MPVDRITRKKLVLTKQLYQRALVQTSASHNDVGKILAVIIFDFAVETVLKAVVSDLEPSKPPPRSFQQVLERADQLLAERQRKPVPDKGNIQHVHNLRNDAQHKAKFPNKTDIEDCRTYVRDFLQKLFLDVWKLSFEKMSLTDIVSHQEVKEYLIAAETALASGEHTEALIKSEAALSTALGLIKEAVVGRMDSHANPNLNYVSWDKSQPSTYALLEMMRDHIVRATVGLNFTDYSRYRRIVDSVIDSIEFMADGHYDVNRTGRLVALKDAEFVVAYAVNAVIQIEDVAGTLDDSSGLTSE